MVAKQKLLWIMHNHPILKQYW